MKLYKETKDYKLYNGSMLDMLEVIEPNSIDSIVCDPPYGLTSITKRFGKENSAECKYGKDGSFQRLSKGFMGKEWDGSGIEYNVNAWEKCYEVLKPGGYLLAFGGSRTFHRIACAIEDAGFEIRDTIMWLYGSGFPKSMNIGLALDKKNGVESKVIGTQTKGSSPLPANHNGNWCDNQKDGKFDIKQAQNEWAGWGTALKPSYEPIIVARKPFKGSLVDNVIEYGVGGINIDECRVEPTGEDIGRNNHKNPYGNDRTWNTSKTPPQDTTGRYEGRFPANTILTYDETDFDEVCGGMPDTKSVRSARGGARNDGTTVYNKIPQNIDMNYECGFDDSGSASRYFYNAKASKKDRDEGLDAFEEQRITDGSFRQNLETGRMFGGTSIPKRNIHPTVKPIELMQYLVRLVSPKGATILDCFMGSGSTGKAVMFENRERDANYKFIGIELTDEYLPICESRIEYAINKYEYDLEQEQKQALEDKGQLSLDLFGEENK